MKHGKETCSEMFKIKNINSELQKCSVCSTEIVGSEAGDAMTKLCGRQATKNGWVGCSAKPLGAHCDEEMANM